MMRSASCIAVLLVGALASQAEARLFAWSYAANCCVDHYRYFGCSYSKPLHHHGGTCEYRGYFVPRYPSTNQYDLYAGGCAPNSHLSPAYSHCPNHSPQRGAIFTNTGDTSHLYAMLYGMPSGYGGNGCQ